MLRQLRVSDPPPAGGGGVGVGPETRPCRGKAAFLQRNAAFLQRNAAFLQRNARFCDSSARSQRRPKDNQGTKGAPNPQRAPNGTL